jgi:hypothetical protein
MRRSREEILRVVREELERKLGVEAPKDLFKEGQKLTMKEIYTLSNFPEPFVSKGKADVLFVFGATRRYEKDMSEKAIERAAVDDILSTLPLVQELSKHVAEGKIEGWLDTWDEEKLREHNLIVIGSPRVNLVARKINESDEFWFRYIIPSNPSLASHYGGRPILDPIMRAVHQWVEPHRLGLISYGKSPYNPEKYALMLFGHGGPGTMAAIQMILNDIEGLQKRPFGGVVKGKVDWSHGIKILDVEWLTKPYSIEEYAQGILWAKSVYSKFREQYPTIK